MPSSLHFLVPSAYKIDYSFEAANQNTNKVGCALKVETHLSSSLTEILEKLTVISETAILFQYQ